MKPLTQQRAVNTVALVAAGFCALCVFCCGNVLGGVPSAATERKGAPEMLDYAETVTAELKKMNIVFKKIPRDITRL